MVAATVEHLSERLLQLPKTSVGTGGGEKGEDSPSDSDPLPAHSGVDGYRRMRIYLQRQGIYLSAVTVHKYMNKELGLRSIVQRKPPKYHAGAQHVHFTNLLGQEFTAETINQKWLTDFTYLFLTGGDVRYNCTILDLYDRSVIASITDCRMTSELAIRTLEKALNSQRKISKELIPHSDQGSPYTSRAFTEFCAQRGITQSMSKAGCPYDNAPMERYFKESLIK